MLRVHPAKPGGSFAPLSATVAVSPVDVTCGFSGTSDPWEKPWRERERRTAHQLAARFPHGSRNLRKRRSGGEDVVDRDESTAGERPPGSQRSAKVLLARAAAERLLVAVGSDLFKDVDCAQPG